MLALKSTAEMFKDEFPEAADFIINNSYVDDIIGGGEDIPSVCKLMKDVNIRYKPRKDGPYYNGLKDIIVSRSAHRVVVILPFEDR